MQPDVVFLKKFSKFEILKKYTQLCSNFTLSPCIHQDLFFQVEKSCVICISIPRCKKVKPRFNWIKSFNSGQLKGVFAKNERGYRLKTINNRFWSLIILLLSVSSIWRKLLKNSLYFIIFLIFCFFKLMFHLQLVFTTGAFPENMKIVVFIIKILETGILSLKVTLRS